ncbi:MAG: hypothetical protein ACU836_10055 [Gammaproteobacteria bacterium]
MSPNIKRLFFGILVSAALPAAASTYTIPLLATDADGRTDATWTYYGDGSTSVDIFNSDLKVGTLQYSGSATTPIRYRSITEFNLASLPDNETVTSAMLSLYDVQLFSQGLFALGWLEHLDSASATGHPDTDYGYAALAQGQIVAPLMPADIPVGLVAFDVTAAVQADHANNRGYSAFSLIENSSKISRAYFTSEEFNLLGGGNRPALIVNTAPVPLPPAGWLLLVGLTAMFTQSRRPVAIAERQ